MAKLSQTQCENVVHRYFLLNGWLPAGTTKAAWKSVTMKAMEFDDPPLPSKPHLQKQRVARELQDIFFMAGAKLPSPLDRLRDPQETLGGLTVWCAQNNS